MAYCNLWPEYRSIRDAIDYARDDRKTAKDSDAVPDGSPSCYVSCINMSLSRPFDQQFQEVRDQWRKTGGILCMKGFQSFCAGELDVDLAHSLGMKLAEDLCEGEFQVIVATHRNTGCLHNHFVFNAVSAADGHMIPAKAELVRKMRSRNNELCREHGLDRYENYHHYHRKSRAEYLAEKEGRPTVWGMICEDIDRAADASRTRNEFFRNLKYFGYELDIFDENGREKSRPGLRPDGYEHFFRFDLLREGYSLPEISDRIWTGTDQMDLFSREETEEIRQYREQNPPPAFTEDRLDLVYVRYQYEMNILYEHPGWIPHVSRFLRQDLIYMDKLDADMEFLTACRIATTEKLTQKESENTERYDKLTRKRHALFNRCCQLRHQGRFQEAEQKRNLALAITPIAREIRREQKIIARVKERAGQTLEELKHILRQIEAKRELPAEPERSAPAKAEREPER